MYRIKIFAFVKISSKSQTMKFLMEWLGFEEGWDLRCSIQGIVKVKESRQSHYNQSLG